MCSPPRCCSPSGLSTLRGLGGIYAPVDRCRFLSLLCFVALSQCGQLYPDGFSSHPIKGLQGPLQQRGSSRSSFRSPPSTPIASGCLHDHELHERKRLPVLLSSFCRPSVVLLSFFFTFIQPLLRRWLDQVSSPPLVQLLENRHILVRFITVCAVLVADVLHVLFLVCSSSCALVSTDRRPPLRLVFRPLDAIALSSTLFNRHRRPSRKALAPGPEVCDLTRVRAAWQR